MNPSDIQTAIDEAAPGETISLPAGRVSWSAGVRVTKPLTIQGAGAEATVIERALDTTQVSFTDPFFILGPLESDEPLRLSGVGFDNKVIRPSYDLCALRVNGTRGQSFGLTKIRIDHCNFSAGQRQLWIGDWAHGVCDHCKFVNGDIFFRDEGYAAFEHPDAAMFGSLAAWYVEDCSFVHDERMPDFLGVMDVDYNGSTVWRYCTIEVANSGGAGIWNTHGNQTYWNPASENYYTGLRRLEVYKCKATLPTCYRLSYARGGRLLYWANEFTTRDGSNPCIAGIAEEEANPDYFDPVRITWPGEESIHSSFFWENTTNGKPTASPATWMDDDALYLQENRDYWLRAPGPDTVTEYPRIGPPSRWDYPYQLKAPYWPPTTSFTPAPYPHPLISENPVEPQPEPPEPASSSYNAWLNALAQWIKNNPPLPDQT